MMTRVLPWLGLLLTLSATAGAQQAAPPPIVEAGFEAFLAQGPTAAIETWFKGSRLEGDEATMQTFVEQFQNFGGAAGPVIGYDIVRVFPIGQHLSTTYAILQYEQDPLFILMTFYEGAGGWRLRNIEFNDEAEELFPAALLEP
jgi:hypothetical protein